jgi:uncharacterized protein DUF922
MKIALWAAAALCAGCVLAAQAIIEWSTDRRLAKADFRGRVPRLASMTSLSAVGLEVEWRCEGDALYGMVRATFDPARSWWRPGDASGRGHRADAQLLQHEQLHFDLAQIAARTLQGRFESLKSACAQPDGRLDVERAVADVDRELQEQQSRYDRETDHGLNGAAQDRWTKAVQRQLGLPAR